MSRQLTATAALLVLVSSAFSAAARQSPEKAPYLDPSLSRERRAEDLVSRMTLEEKVSQMQSAAPAIPRLAVPEYDRTNAGARPGDEVVQLYVIDVESSVRVPVRSLQGARRIRLAPGEAREVNFTLEPSQLAIVDDSGTPMVEPGDFVVTVGGEQPGFSGRADAGTTSVVEGRFWVQGTATCVSDLTARRLVSVTPHADGGSR